MRKISEQLIAALAVNAAALSNARKISQKGGFVKLFVLEMIHFIWVNVQEAANQII